MQFLSIKNTTETIQQSIGINKTTTINITTTEIKPIGRNTTKNCGRNRSCSYDLRLTLKEIEREEQTTRFRANLCDDEKLKSSDFDVVRCSIFPRILWAWFKRQ